MKYTKEIANKFMSKPVLNFSPSKRSVYKTVTTLITKSTRLITESQ
jgi:hypothetical protein